MRESLPSFEPPDEPAALFPSSLENGGGAPGWRALDVSDVLVDDRRTVELVASCRVVVVVLLLVALLVLDVVEDGLVEGLVVVELPAPTEMTMTPAIPTPPGPPWILQ